MIILITGVSGSGKSTVGKMLATALKWDFSDGDSFHSLENIEKMKNGIPLNDADRQPWLEKLQHAIDQWLATDKNVVLACSALKEAYRQALWRDKEQMRLVYLKGSFELIQKRLQERTHHYMKVNLLQSQFDTLEEPQEAIVVDIANSPAVNVQKIKQSLGI